MSAGTATAAKDQSRSETFPKRPGNRQIEIEYVYIIPQTDKTDFLPAYRDVLHERKHKTEDERN